MTNKAESTRKLLHAMSDFHTQYGILLRAIEEYEEATNSSVNDLPGFAKSYPFDKSFDELAIGQWVTDTIDGVTQCAYKVLNYEYLNTGGNCMVGIFEVWLPAMKRTVYAYVNEEGCSLSLVDYIRNEIELDDYDEVLIENVDWGRITGYETYFELYRDCFNEYTKSDCKYFGYTRQVPYLLLSLELQESLDRDYRLWCDNENGGMFETDGHQIVVSPAYDAPVDEWAIMVEALKRFKEWHDETAGVEDLYDKNYVLEFAGHRVELPYCADVWDAVDTMLDRAINDI